MDEFREKSFLLKLYLEEREEVMKHKWVLSERAGYDVGYHVAVFSWVRYHRTKWLESQMKNKPKS